MLICPKCSAKIPPSQEECSHCGIIIQKYSAIRENAIKKAELLYQKQDYKGAIQLFEQIQKKFPEIQDQIQNKMISIEKKLQEDLYKADLQQALDKLNDNNLESAQLLFQAMENKHPNYSKDIKKYLEQISKNQSKIIFNNAVENFKQKKYIDAKRDFLKLVNTEYELQSKKYLKEMEPILKHVDDAEKLSFYNSLFDFSFSAKTFITTRIMKYVYGFHLVLISIVAMLSFITGLFKLTYGETDGLLFIIISPLFFIFFMVISRLMLEFVIVIFKIYDSLEVLVENTNRNT